MNVNRHIRRLSPSLHASKPCNSSSSSSSEVTTTTSSSETAVVPSTLLKIKNIAWLSTELNKLKLELEQARSDGADQLIINQLEARINSLEATISKLNVSEDRKFSKELQALPPEMQGEICSHLDLKNLYGLRTSLLSYNRENQDPSLISLTQLETAINIYRDIGKVRCIESMIAARGGDINKLNNYGTLLHEAVNMDDSECVLILLEKGADINSKDHCGQTPLYNAAQYCKVKMAKLLIERGADIYAQAHNGETALVFYSIWSDTEVKQLLIERGAGDSCHYEYNRAQACMGDFDLDDESISLMDSLNRSSQ